MSGVIQRAQTLAERSLGRAYESLTDREKHVLAQIHERRPISTNTNREFDETATFGERVADRVAAFGGSWTFILLFGGVLVVWVILNSVVLLRAGEAFDPYPYILLNLVLSMLAALQAPVIMMSQNRQAAKDRLDAAHDYEVNLKSEIEIRHLHDKLDCLRDRDWAELVAMQQEQIRMLSELLEERSGGGGTPEP